MGRPEEEEKTEDICGYGIFLIYFLFVLQKYTIISKFSKTNLPPSWSIAVRVNLFLKSRNFFFNSGGDKLYMKLITFDETCDFI
jgi:hypothetical protein